MRPHQWASSTSGVQGSANWKPREQMEGVGVGQDSDVRAFISLALSPGPRWPAAFLNRRSQPFSQWPSFLLLGSDNVSLSSFPSSGGGKRALLCPL